MIREVVLTELASNDLEKITDYLFDNYNLKVVSNFLNRFETISIILAENPELFPYIFLDQKIQKCVLTKHNVIYFRVNANIIEILAVFDTRQDPEKLIF